MPRLQQLPAAFCIGRDRVSRLGMPAVNHLCARLPRLYTALPHHPAPQHARWTNSIRRSSDGDNVDHQHDLRRNMRFCGSVRSPAAHAGARVIAARRNLLTTPS